jgi:NADPH:quinone reductase-like Zn-dependent oxidoreductase
MAEERQMQALLLKNGGYSDRPDDVRLPSLEPYLELSTIDVPQPSGTQVLIRVALSPINPADIMFMKGLYGQPRMKGMPAGFEGVGEVVAAGEDQRAQALLGKRVAFIAGNTGYGSWAGFAMADVAVCIPLMDGLRDEDAAAMIVNPLTAIAMFGLVRQEGVKAFVMTAAASQLCKLITGLAAEAGYRAIAVVRRDDQMAALRELGATHVLNETAAGFEEEFARIAKEEKPRMFLDAVTGPTASTIFRHMPRGARWVIYGRLSAKETAIPEPGQLIFANKKIEGFWLSQWLRTADAGQQAETAIEAQTRFMDGRWKTEVTAIVPLAEAMERVPAELARPNGKVFIKP